MAENKNTTPHAQFVFSSNVPAVFTTETAAQLLSVSTKEIRRLIHDGDLRCSKIGKGFRITGEQISDMLRRLEIPITEAAQLTDGDPAADRRSGDEVKAMETKDTSAADGKTKGKTKKKKAEAVNAESTTGANVGRDSSMAATDTSDSPITTETEMEGI